MDRKRFSRKQRSCTILYTILWSLLTFYVFQSFGVTCRHKIVLEKTPCEIQNIKVKNFAHRTSESRPINLFQSTISTCQFGLGKQIQKQVSNSLFGIGLFTLVKLVVLNIDSDHIFFCSFRS